MICGIPSRTAILCEILQGGETLVEAGLTVDCECSLLNDLGQVHALDLSQSEEEKNQFG
jgi:hypothetical protein